MDKIGFGSRVQELRTKKGWSLEYLGKQIGISKSMLEFVENGYKTASLEVTENMCRVLNTSMDYLLYGKDGRRVIDVTGLPEDYINLVSSTIDIMRREQTKK